MLNKRITSEAILLLVRLASSSALFLGAISALTYLGHKDAVGDFISLQNRALIAATFGSLGFHSVFLYYGSRSKTLLRWSIVQQVSWLPLMAIICLGVSFVIEATSPSIGVLSLSLFALTLSISGSAAGIFIGSGRIASFTAIEICSSFTFLVASLVYSAHTPVLGSGLLFIFTAIQLAKSAIFIAGGLLSTGNGGKLSASRLFPSIPLMRRFAGPSWIIGNVSALAYRGVLILLQSSSGASTAADIAIAWAIFDRVQNVVQVANTLSFRRVAREGRIGPTILRTVALWYPPIAATGYISLSVLFSIWSWKSSANIPSATLWISAFFFMWGYRSLFQNLLLARRMYRVVLVDLICIVGAWAFLWGLQMRLALDLRILVAVVSCMLIASACVLLRWASGHDGR